MRTPQEEMSQMTRRSLLWAAGSVALGYGAWRWLVGSPQEHRIVSPLRRGLELNEKLWGRVIGPQGLTPTFDRNAIQAIRTNGRVGLRTTDALVESMTLVLGDGRTQEIAYADIQAIGMQSMVVEFKCVEGWSRILEFEGVPLADFFKRYASGEKPIYVSMESPGREYMVGLDWASCIHPQSLLCFRMNGEPLRPENGHPMRLAMPIKYGYKQIKNIAVIRVTDLRPADYWAQRGYDWYAGL